MTTWPGSVPSNALATSAPRDRAMVKTVAERRHGHPEPGLAPALAPRRSRRCRPTGASRTASASSSTGASEARRRTAAPAWQIIPVEIDRPNRSAGQLPDLPLAQAVAAGQQAEHRLQPGAEAPRRDARGQRRTGGGAAAAGRPGDGAGTRRPSGSTGGQLGDLMAQGLGVLAEQGLAAAAAGRAACSRRRAGAARAGPAPRWWRAMAGLPAPLLPGGLAGGPRFTPIGSEEGGLEELVELRLSRASRSATRRWRTSCCSTRVRINA